MNFDINLSGDMAKKANADADALQRLYDATQKESKALAAMEAQRKKLGAAGVTDVAAGRALNKSIEEQRRKVSALTTEMVNLGGAGYQPVKEHSTALADAMEKLADKGGGVGKFLASMGPWGIAAAAALVLVTGALVAAGAALYKLTQLAIQFSEARGDFERSLESIYGSQEAAKHTYDVISTITDRVAVSQEKALEIFGKLERAGIRNGDQAVKATEAIAKAEAARKGAGDALQGVLERAGKSRYFSISRDELRQAGLTYRELATTISKQTGRGIKEAELALRTGRVTMGAGLDALSKTVDQKLGPIANKKLLTVGIQSDRLKDNLGRLFSGVDTSKIATVLQRVADLFNENTVSGRALKVTIEGIFSGVSRAVELASPYVETFFKGAILLALKLYNAFRPVGAAIERLFGGDSLGKQKSFEDSVIAGANNIAGAFEKVSAVMVRIIDAWEKIHGLASIGAGLVQGDASGVVAGYAELTKASGGNGKAVAQGLAQGISAGSPGVIGAMADLAAMGLAAFRDKMEIRSPSRVMARQGRYLNEGLAQGIDDSAKVPAKSLAKVTPADSVGADGVARGGGSGATVTFGEGSIVINVAGAGAEFRNQVTETFIGLFQQLGLTMGAGANG